MSGPPYAPPPILDVEEDGAGPSPFEAPLSAPASFDPLALPSPVAALPSPSPQRGGGEGRRGGGGGWAEAAGVLTPPHAAAHAAAVSPSSTLSSVSRREGECGGEGGAAAGGEGFVGGTREGEAPRRGDGAGRKGRLLGGEGGARRRKGGGAAAAGPRADGDGRGRGEENDSANRKGEAPNRRARAKGGAATSGATAAPVADDDSGSVEAEMRRSASGAEEAGAAAASSSPRMAVCPCCSAAVDTGVETLSAHVSACFQEAGGAAALPPVAEQVASLSAVAANLDIRVRLGFAESFARLASKASAPRADAGRPAAVVGHDQLKAAPTQAEVADQRLLRLLHRSDAPPGGCLMPSPAAAPAVPFEAAPPPPLHMAPLSPRSPLHHMCGAHRSEMRTPVYGDHHLSSSSSSSLSSSSEPAVFLPSPLAAGGRSAKSQRKLFDVSTVLCDTLPSPRRAAPRALRPRSPPQSPTQLKRMIKSKAEARGALAPVRAGNGRRRRNIVGA